MIQLITFMVTLFGVPLLVGLLFTFQDELGWM